jgi:hypothetical protein
MSLQALRDMRRQGLRPQEVFLLIVGARPQWAQDDATKQFLAPTTRVTDLDLRPLIGMHFAIVMTQKADALLDSLLNALEAVKAIPWGVALQDGRVLLAATEPDAAAERNLYETWRQYA